jgi:hypothetical protein
MPGALKDCSGQAGRSRSRWRVSFGCRRALGGRSDGRVTVTDPARERQRSGHRQLDPWVRRGASALTAEYRRHHPKSWIPHCVAHTMGWRAKHLRECPARHLVSEVSTGFSCRVRHLQLPSRPLLRRLTPSISRAVCNSQCGAPVVAEPLQGRHSDSNARSHSLHHQLQLRHSF